MLTTPAFDTGIRPIFLLGASGSGASLLSWALGQHPNIQVMQEASWVATIAAGGRLSHGYGSARGHHSHLSNARYDLAPFMRRLGEFVHQVVQDCFEERCHRRYGPFRETGTLEAPGRHAATDGFELRHSIYDPKQRWVDATPFNTYFTWALAQMVPGARFVLVLRSPADLAASLPAFERFEQAPAELEAELRSWASHAGSAWMAERWLGAGKVFRADYSRLASEPDVLVSDLLGFLGEPWFDACAGPLRALPSARPHPEPPTGLQDNPVFATCLDLYRNACERLPSDTLDETAGEQLRAQFETYCERHPLV